MKMICNQTNCEALDCRHRTSHDHPKLSSSICAGEPIRFGQKWACEPIPQQASFWVLKDSLYPEEERFIGQRAIGGPVRAVFEIAVHFETRQEAVLFRKNHDIRTSFVPVEKDEFQQPSQKEEEPVNEQVSDGLLLQAEHKVWIETYLFWLKTEQHSDPVTSANRALEQFKNTFAAEVKATPSVLKTLEKHNKEVEEQLRLIDHGQRNFRNGLECPECGAELWDTSYGTALMSNPAKKRIHCKADECSYTGTCLLA